MKNFARWMVGGAALLLAHGKVLAVDAIAVEGGPGEEDSVRGGAALVWDWGVKWFDTGNWYLGGQWEASFSYWDADESGEVGSLAEIGLTPVFRIQPQTSMGGISPFLEGAIGVHLFSETELGGRDFGSIFSFGDHLGAGVRFGANSQYELNYRYQHLSNASLADPNDGINFHLLRFAYHFH